MVEAKQSHQAPRTRTDGLRTDKLYRREDVLLFTKQVRLDNGASEVDILRHLATFWDILGHFRTFWDIVRQFGRLCDEFGAFRPFS